MAGAYSWNCPYCNQNATITYANTGVNHFFFNFANKEGDLCLASEVVVCPNPACREYALRAVLFRAKTISALGAPAMQAPEGDPIADWKLRPKSSSKAFPAYIPKPILDDYDEACLIVNESPKASATLSRRCLQGMIRDFWNITKPRLVDEIEALNGQIDTTTWDAIDAVRGVGNIGAHMEKDINLIVEVDPDEAKLLIGLIEFLLKDWYVGRYEREEHKKKVIALGAAKAAAKAPAKH